MAFLLLHPIFAPSGHSFLSLGDYHRDYMILRVPNLCVLLVSQRASLYHNPIFALYCPHSHWPCAMMLLDETSMQELLLRVLISKRNIV